MLGSLSHFLMRLPRGISRINAYVAAIVGLAALAMLAASTVRGDFIGAWALGVFALIALLLEGSPAKLRSGNAVGSLAFILHLSSFLLFGPFWAGVITASSTLAAQLVLGGGCLTVDAVVGGRAERSDVVEVGQELGGCHGELSGSGVGWIWVSWGVGGFRGPG